MNRLTLKSGEEIELNQAFNCDCLEFMKKLPDKCINLLMVDPPYFEVKGDFDFIWDSFADYLKDVEKWAIECKRILADNGSMFWWGHAKKIAYSQIILDKYFHLENAIVWNKFDSQTNKNKPESMRSFKPVTERLLFYSNEVEKTGLQEIYDSPDCFKPIKKYMREERKKVIEYNGFKKIEEFNIYIRKITNTSSVVDRHYFADSQYCFPTDEIYKKLQGTGFFRREYEELRREYEELRREYEELRRPFNLELYNFTDIIKASQEGHISGQYDHETIKPLGLIKKLLQTTTRKGDIVYSPFWGSGTDSVACHELGLNWIATELDKKHFKNAQDRYTKETKQLLMDF